MKSYSKIIGIFVVSFFMITHHSQTALAQEGYHNNKELKKSLEDLADDYSDLIELQSIGKTLSDQELFLITLSSGEPESKPALLIVAGVNGPDLAGTEIALNFIRTTAETYGEVDSITQILENRTIYIMPRVNPEAVESFFSEPIYARTLNSRPMDLDQDSQVDEDGYDDLDRDGEITYMRIQEPGGEWMNDEDYPGLLKKADHSKGEQGMYRLIREGYDNDGDGELNEDEPGGVDFNLNFPYQYQYFQIGAGYHQVSESETRAVADFIYSHSNIAAVFSFSPNDNLVESWKSSERPGAAESGVGPRGPATTVDSDDGPYYQHISDIFKRITGFDTPPPSGDENGAFSLWAYYHIGRWSFSVPAWWQPEVKPTDDASSAEGDSLQGESTDQTEARRPGRPQQDEKKSIDQLHWEWLQSTNQTDGFVPWEEIDHPDFPDKVVEVGGFKSFAYTNPPADSITSLSQKFTPFLYQLCSSLPQIEINSQKVEHLHDNVYRLTIVISNTGYLPTNPSMGIPIRWCPKVKLALELTEDQSLASGRVYEFIDMLAGTGDSEEFSWIVIGSRGDSVKLSAGSPMTGIVETTFELQ